MELCVFSSLLTVLCVGLYGKSTYADKRNITQPLNEALSVTEGKPLMINCSADGNPSPRYNWTLPNNTTISNSSIHISRVRKEDQGQYICTAYNDVGQATRTVNVTVIEVCTDPVVTSASLLVEYGDPAEVNCSIPSKPETDYLLGWESKTSQPATDTKTSVMWKVDSLTNWEEADGLQCYFSVGSTQCESNVNLTIFKTPDRVTLSSVSDVWVEGNQTELRCEIENVGPGHKLSVRWSRADPKHNNAFTQFNETSFPDLVNEMKNVSMTVNLTITPSREDDGVQYQCAAVLNVDQPPLNYTSQPLNITVHYKPNITQPLNEALSVTEGKPLMLTCSADGNPSPRYNWTLLNNTTISNSSIHISRVRKEDQGQYICTAYNDVGQATRNVTVKVIAGHNPHFIYYIVAIIVMVVSAVVIAVCCTYYRRTRMGQYILKHLRSRRHNGYLDHNAEDQAQL